MRADAFATCLANKDYRSFWSSIHKQSNAKSTIYANVIDGCTGDRDVAEMWRKHYQQLYNPVHDDQSRDLLFKRLEDASSQDSGYIVTVREVVDAINKH